MTQLHGRTRFSVKTTSRRLVFDQSLMKKLDRDRTVHQEVARTIDRTHATFAKTFFEVVFFVEGLTDEWILLCLQSITAGGSNTLMHHQVDLTILLHRGL